MNDSKYTGIEDYLTALESALGRPNGQSRDIVDEVRADLSTQVEHLQADGLSHPEAVQQALGEMGNPYELAHQVKQQIPPFGGTAITAIRYVAAGGLILWLGVLLWLMRGWSYGISGLTVTLAILFMHLPVILLLWPRIVWRRNWLFGLIPAGIGLAVVLLLNLGGVESSQEIVFPQSEEEIAALNRQLEQQAAAGDDTSAPILILATAGIVTFILLMAIQRKVQRRVVLIALVLGASLIEVPFQIEEMVFRQDVESIHRYLEANRGADGSYPGEEEFRAAGPELRTSSPGLRMSDQSFSLFWTRPLSSGFSIRYSSEDGHISIQD